MKKLLQTKFVLIALFVAAPAVAAGTAATVGSAGDENGPAAVVPADVQLAADREDDVAEVEAEDADEQGDDAAKQQANPKRDQSAPADTVEQENEVEDGDANEVDQPEADDQDDEAENDDDQGEQEDQGESDDESGDD